MSSSWRINFSTQQLHVHPSIWHLVVSSVSDPDQSWCLESRKNTSRIHVQILATTQMSQVTLRKLLNPSEPQLTYLQNRDPYSNLGGILLELYGIACLKHLDESYRSVLKNTHWFSVSTTKHGPQDVLVHQRTQLVEWESLWPTVRSTDEGSV